MLFNKRKHICECGLRIQVIQKVRAQIGMLAKQEPSLFLNIHVHGLNTTTVKLDSPKFSPFSLNLIA